VLRRAGPGPPSPPRCADQCSGRSVMKKPNRGRLGRHRTPARSARLPTAGPCCKRLLFENLRRPGDDPPHLEPSSISDRTNVDDAPGECIRRRVTCDPGPFRCLRTVCRHSPAASRSHELFRELQAPLLCSGHPRSLWIKPSAGAATSNGRHAPAATRGECWRLATAPTTRCPIR